MGKTAEIKEAIEDQMIPNWQRVLKRAWSVRLMALAAGLQGLEAILPFFDLPAWIVFSVIVAAFVARFYPQGLET